MKKTKSYTYLLPMIADHLKFKPQIVNIFLADQDYPQYNDKIFVLYRFHGKKEFIKYEEDIKKHPLYVASYDPDKYHVMKVFRVPESQKLNFLRFKNSEYSKMADSYKTKVLSFHNKSKDHPLYHILYKTEEAFLSLERDIGQPVPRSQEAGTLVEISKETYTSDMKVKDAIYPREDNKAKPFKFNTRGAQ